MGTDMEVQLEMDESNEEPAFSAARSIHSLTTGSFLVDRDYSIFDALAGGRDSVLPHQDRDPRSAPLFAPRGLPNPCSISVARSYYFLVAKPNDPPNCQFWEPHRCVTPETAKEWLRYEGCHEGKVVQWINGDRTWRVVSGPGNYNATWLSFDEANASLKHHGLTWDSSPITFRALRDAMACLVREYGSPRVRMTLWFN